MIRQIIGSVLTLLGFLFLFYGPGDGRPQLPSFGRTSMLVGVTMIIIGVLLIKL